MASYVNHVNVANGDIIIISFPPAPVIVTDPVSTMVPIYTEATFSCEVSAEEDSLLNISYIGPTPLPLPDNTFQANSSSFLSVLTFNVTGAEFEGNYSCIAVYANCVTRVVSSPASFSILPPPVVISGPIPDVLASVNDDITLTCNSTNIGNISITWSGTKLGLVGVESVQEEVFASTLTLSSVDSTDGGVYTCSARNEAGEDSASGVVFVAPVVSPLARAGDMVIFTCVVQEFPVVGIRWEVLNPDTGMFEPLAGETQRNLTFMRAFFSSGGSYRCVTNTTLFGETNSTTAQLTGE